MNKVKHNRLVRHYQAYKKECAKNGVLHRDYTDWLEYFNILEEGDQNEHHNKP